MDDPELVRAVRGGDVAAFTAIFDRHAARVHDLALAMLRDRSAALEVVESSFLEASLRLHALQEDHRLAVWLLSVTRRNGALRAGPTAGADRQPSLSNADPEQARLATLVWEAVADLPLRERTLIDLDLRQGLDGQDLADALGVTAPQAQDLQRRMRDRIEKGLSGYLIARTAEGRCTGLTKVLKGWDGRFTPATSGRIANHVDGCTVCNQIRFGLPSPFVLYASALHAPFPAAVRPRVLDGLVLPAVAPLDAPLGQAPPLQPTDAPWSSPYAPPQPDPVPALSPPWSPTPAGASSAAAYPDPSGLPGPQPYAPVPPLPVPYDAAASAATYDSTPTAPVPHDATAYPPRAVTAATYDAASQPQEAAPPVHDSPFLPQAPSPAAYGATSYPEQAHAAIPYPEAPATAYEPTPYPAAPTAPVGYDATHYPEAPAFDAPPYPDTAAPPTYDATAYPEAPAYDATPYPDTAAPPAYDATAYPEAATPSAFSAAAYPDAPAAPPDDDANSYPYAPAPGANDGTSYADAPAAPPDYDATPWLAEPTPATDDTTPYPEPATPPADQATPNPEPATSQSQVIASPAASGAPADAAPPLAVAGSAAGAMPADADPEGVTQLAQPDEPAEAPEAVAPAPPSPLHDTAAEPDGRRPAPTAQETP